MTIQGAKKGQGSQRKPVIAPDSAQSKTYINMLYGLAEGEIAGLANGFESVYLDDTPLQNNNGEFNFPGVKVDFRSGTNDQDYIEGFPDVASETAVGVELKAGTPWVKAFNNLDLDAVRVRMKWGALRTTNEENGDVDGVKIDYAIDVKTDNGGWVQTLQTAINAKTSDAYERSHRIDLPKATQGWQVRVRRITPNSTSDYISDKMYISAVTEVIDLKLRYPNTALLGLRYDATSFGNVAKMAVECDGLIINVPTNYNPAERTYQGIWDGLFKEAYSNNPAWVYYDICTSDRYGLGDRIKPFMIDKWSLYRLAQYCDELVDDGMGGKEPRFAVNVYIQSAEEAFALLAKLAGVFRAITYWDGASIVVDADIPQDSLYSFSRANVIDGVFEYTGTRTRNRRSVAKVAWDNPKNRYKTEHEFVRDEKAIAQLGVRIADIAAWGCTSKGQAQRAGLWALKSEQLETRMVSFKVGLDGHIPAPAKVIEISDELFAGRANGGRVLAISGDNTVITLDRAITANVGDTLVINGDDGVSQRRQIVSSSGATVTVDKAFGAVSAENVWVLDTKDLATMKFRVLSVTANGDDTFVITAVQYNPAKYDAIDTGAYIDERPISVINPTMQAPTKSVNLSSYHTVNQGVSVTTLVIGWEQVAGAVKYAVEWRKDNGNWQTLPPTGTNSIEITGVYAGQYEARVTAISAFGQASLATHSNLTEIQGKVGKPNRPAFIRVTGVLFGMNLTWGFAAASDDTNFTEIQVSPDGRSNITTLGTFAYPTNKHEITGLQGNLTQFYRARIVDKLGNVSDWTDWTSGTTEAQADKVLSLLTGQITASQLHQDLSTPIGKIGGIESSVNSLQQAISSTASNLDTLNRSISDANSRITQAQSELDSAVSEIGTNKVSIASAIRDIGALRTADSQINTQINGLQSNYNSLSASISAINTTIARDKESLTQQINQAQATADNTASQLSSVQQALASETQARTTAIDALAARLSNSGNLVGNVTRGQFWYVQSNAPANHNQYSLTDFIAIKPNTNYVIQATNGTLRYLHIAYFNATRQLITSQVAVGATAKSHYQLKHATASFIRFSYQHTMTDSVVMTQSDAFANIDSVRDAMTTADSALSRRIDTLDASYKQADTTLNASITAEQQARTTADSALSQRINALDAAYKSADTQANAKIATLEQSITDKDSALSRRIDTLDASYKQADTALNSSITAEQQARTNADNALSQRITALDTAYKSADTQANAKIATLEQSITDKDSALSRRIDTLDASYKQADTALNSSITAEQQARADGDTALTSRIDSLSSDYNSNKASVASQLKTLSDKDTATASQITSLQANVTNAQNTANTANSKANTATTKADNAQATANNALSRANTANSAITTEQTARANADTALSQRISQLDSAYKSADSALSARVATAEQSASDAQQAIAQTQQTLTARIDSATTVRPNLCPDVDKWTLGTAFYTDKSSDWGMTLKTHANDTRVCLSPKIAVREGGVYVLSYDSLRFCDGGLVYCDLQGYNAQGQHAWDGDQVSRSDIHDFATDNRNRDVNAAQYTIPQDITHVQVRFVAQDITGNTAVGVRQVKFEYGSLPASMYSQEADVAGLTANSEVTLQQISQVKATAEGLSAQHTVKIDNGGRVSGYGLASGVGGISDFAVVADKFYIAPPSGGKGTVPFVVRTTPTTVGGVSVPAGVYLSSAYIQNGSIDIAKINKASITSLSALSANIGTLTTRDSRGTFTYTGSKIELRDPQGRLLMEMGLL